MYLRSSRLERLYAIVAGVDFGTLSVRVSIVDSEKGRIGSATAEYPLFRKKEDPDHATQRHADHMSALVSATRKAVEAAGVRGEDVLAIALDTTGSSVIPVGEGLEPLDDYYLWCDHRAKSEAAEITAKAARETAGGDRVVRRRLLFRVGLLEAAALAAPQSRQARPDGHRARALRHGGGRALRDHGSRRRFRAAICAMGHKWMWNAGLGGLPGEEFLAGVDPLLAGVRAKLSGRYATSDQIAGHLTPEWAEKLGLQGGHSRFRWARSTRIGMPSAPASAKATWSTWSAPPPASWRSPRRRR